MGSGRLQFDKWEGLYASRMDHVRHSAVRDLFSAISRPGVIGLSGGMPDISVLPLDQVTQCVVDTIQKEGVLALQYGGTPGRLRCREVVCGTLAELGIDVSPDEVLLATGSQASLDMLGKVFIDPGDPIVTEGPTYVGALQAFSAYQPDVHAVDLDDDGMRMDLLEQTLEGLAREGRRPKFIYTIPNFQNPAGVTMTLERRHQLLDLAHRYGVPVIEDDPYGRLRFEGEDIPALKTMDPDVIYLGTVSKIFAPGLRIGWIVAPKPILAKVNLVKQGAVLCSSPVCEVMAEHYFTETDWHATQKKVVDLYRGRRDAMLAALDEFFPPEAAWTRPQGGFFLWITLPKYFDTDQMLTVALRQGVAFVPGRGCYPDGRGANSLRVAFCYEDHATLREGIRRLSEAISDRMGLYRAMLKAGALPEDTVA